MVTVPANRRATPARLVQRVLPCTGSLCVSSLPTRRGAGASRTLTSGFASPRGLGLDMCAAAAAVAEAAVTIVVGSATRRVRGLHGAYRLSRPGLHPFSTVPGAKV